MLLMEKQTNRFKKVCFFIFAAMLFSSILFALEIPKKPQGYVNDYAGVLSAKTRGEIETKLLNFDTATSVQIAVAIFQSLESESLEDFSMRLADAWKIGDKERNNGVLLLIFKNERKIRIEVGYGLEGVLTDALSGIIIRNEIAPHFRKNDYDGGVLAGIEAICKATQNEYKARPRREDEPPFGLRVMILLFVIVFMQVIANKASNGIGTRKRSRIFFTSTRGGGARSSGGRSFGGFGGGSFGGGGASGGW